MKKYFLLFTLKAQINIISNGSFEEFNQCPTLADQIGNATSWFQPYVTSSGSQNSSSDLFSFCCFNNNCRVPNNFVGTQTPRTGNSYAGIWVYFQNSYEYIENTLIDTLKQNKSYCLQFHVSLGDKCKYAVNNIQAYFSNDSCLYITPPYILPYIAQVKNTDTTIVKDKNDWQRISLPYIAQGGEKFVTIGNFDNDSLSYKMYVGNGTINNVGAYYYIDDVSVIDISTSAYAGNDTTIAIGDSVFIGRSPEVGLNEDCIWFVNGNAIDTVAGIYVTPDTTTTYVLQQTICGAVNYDTVTVTVVDPMGLKKWSANNLLEIYPNPNNGKFSIKSKIENQQNTITISNILGEIVCATQLLLNITEIDLSKESKGIYFVTVYTQNKIESRKIIIE